MKTNLSIGLLCGLSVLMTELGIRAVSRPAVAQEQDSAAEAPVTVRLASGRTFTAQVDARSDAMHLWLRWQRGSAVVRRPVRWDRVVQVQVDGRDLSGEEFRRSVEADRPDQPVPAAETTGPKKIVIRGPARPAGSASATSTASRAVRQTPRVRSLAIEAGVANWDADVEVDGLMVRVYPLDAQGAVVPVRGSFSADLTGQWQDTVRRRHPFANMGRWTHQVRQADFGIDGAVYRLPFQGVHPEFDLGVAPQGMVHVRLNVPGQGAFEATESMIRIRPYSATRDELQQATGRRFFVHERTEGRR